MAHHGKKSGRQESGRRSNSTSRETTAPSQPPAIGQRLENPWSRVPDSPWCVIDLEQERIARDRLFDLSFTPTEDDCVAFRARELAALLLRSAHRLEHSKAAEWPTEHHYDRHEWPPNGALQRLEQVRGFVNRVWSAYRPDPHKWYIIDTIELFAESGSAPGVESPARFAIRSIASFNPEAAKKISLELMQRAILAWREPRGNGGRWKTTVELLAVAGFVSPEDAEEFAKEPEPTRASIPVGYRRWRKQRFRK